VAVPADFKHCCIHGSSMWPSTPCVPLCGQRNSPDVSSGHTEIDFLLDAFQLVVNRACPTCHVTHVGYNKKNMMISCYFPLNS
jgi:hypothetical protein